MRPRWESLLPSNLTDWVVITCLCAPASADAPIHSENGLGAPCSTLGVLSPQDHCAFWLVPMCTTYWVVKSTSPEARYQKGKTSHPQCGTHHIYMRLKVPPKIMFNQLDQYFSSLNNDYCRHENCCSMHSNMVAMLWCLDDTHFSYMEAWNLFLVTIFHIW